MSQYDVTTALQLLPAEHLKDWHLAALKAVGFTAEVTEKGVYLFTPKETGAISFNDLEEDGTLEWLGDMGLYEFRGTPFVERLCASVVESKCIDWDDVAKLVLHDMPEDSVPFLDFQGAFFSDKEKPQAFGGFAVRVTREAIHWSQPHAVFFRELSERAELANGSREERIEKATSAVTDGEMSIGDALRLSFPEATQGGESPDMAFALHTAVHGYVEAWADANAPEPQAPAP